METQSPSLKRGRSPQFLAHVLWPNVWIDQDATWYEGRPRPKPHCVTLEPTPHPKKRGAQPPIFGPYLLRPNGCMDQDVTWYGVKPQPRRRCVRWGPSPLPTKGGGAPSPIFGPFLLWPNGCMHQNIKMPLGIELGLSPGDFVLDGDPVPFPHIALSNASCSKKIH